MEVRYPVILVCQEKVPSETPCTPMSGELVKVRSEIDEVQKEINQGADQAERITMRELLLTLDERVNLLKGEEV